MQAVLAQMDLEDALLRIDKMPSTLTDEQKKQKTVAALWKRLEQICMSKTRTSKLHMKHRLYAYRLEECASVHEHLTVFKEILSNLEAIEVQYDKEDLGLILLCSLPPSYSTFRDTILYSRESLTVDEVYDSLTSYDKMKHFVVKPDSQGESLIARGRQDQNTDNNRERIQERNPRGKSKNRSKSSNREDYSDGELLVTSVNDSKVSEEWILDLGCTFHMNPNRDWFTTYETVSEGVDLMRNNASCKIAGVGTIKVKMFDGVVKTLGDVQHVPELKRNLILLSALDSKVYKYTAESGVLKISKAVASSSLSDDDITKLWHMRLGYMSENSMQNGIAERLNRTIMEKVRCMLSNANLPKSFWVEVASTAYFSINRSPSVAIEKKTTQEVRSGNPTNYSDLKIFGCPAYAHVDNGKLEPRSIKCVFLGYKVGAKGYKLWCPENRKVVISRDVVFDETAMLPNLSLKDSSNKDN
ncbi:hypothetical protein CXB51_001204 [Gossypium anomalum]|uniref:Retrovirus-related Pol polyprotein from transposon TNT 1-94 n=1 Tax=Gossypium anomalum TaxID=47600 RepID=A0A8J6DC52_9ROSI|nr:hypothetical protein CXB51_001204 [Gossypium anomalum]